MEKTFLDMTVGACCHRDCKLRKKSVAPSPDELVFVYFEHTRPSREGPTCACPRMHQECFESLQTELLKVITTKTLNRRETLKAMWDDSHQGKFNFIRNLCKCNCGGLLKPITGARGEIATSICGECKPTVEKKRRQNKRATVNFNPEKFKLLWEGNDTKEEDCIDEDAAAFLWKPDSSVVDNMPKKPKEQELPDFAEVELFPDLPFSGCLPSAPKAKIQSSGLKNPEITIRNRFDIICVIVDKERHGEWIGWLLGHKGLRIQRMDNEYNTITHIDMESHANIKLVVAKKFNDTKIDNRLRMAEKIVEEIKKKLSLS